MAKKKTNQPVSISMPPELIAAMNIRIRELSMKRSDYVCKLIRADLIRRGPLTIEASNKPLSSEAKDGAETPVESNARRPSHPGPLS